MGTVVDIKEATNNGQMMVHDVTLIRKAKYGL
jgi:hypothetical protein